MSANHTLSPHDLFADSYARFDDERRRQDAIRPIRDSLLDAYRTSTRRAAEGSAHAEYCVLQSTWNQKVIEISSRYVLDGSIGRDRALSLGSFLGLVEIAYANVFQEVVCVDQDDYLAEFRPSNLRLHKADLDTSKWVMPEGRFNICFMVEILEHFLWSPVALLKWIHANCDMLIITTPDDREWPALANKPYMRHQHFSAVPSATGDVTGNPEPMSHCKQYTQEEFIELLSFCGFRLVEFQRVGAGSNQMLAVCTPRRGAA
ncbi:methyltransferase domain-containing protein [Lysobacter tyrosinilyticus]